VGEESTGGSILIDQVSEWLMAQALGTGRLEGIFKGCCDRLVAAGVPLSRGFLAFRTLHPLYPAMTVTWKLGQDVVVKKGRHGALLHNLPVALLAPA
jgi:adenylate cyclase